MFKNIVKDTYWVILGNIIFAFSQWIVLIIINKFGSAEDVGVFTLSLAILNPIFILAQCGIRSYIIIDVRNEYNFSVYLKLRLILSIIAIILSCFITIDKDYFFVVFLLSIYKFIDNILDIYYGQYQRIRKMKNIGISKFLRSSLTVIIFVSAYYFSRSLIFSLFFYFGASFLVWFFYDRLSTITTEKVHVSKTAVIHLLKRSLPLAISAVIIALNSSLPRFFLEKDSGVIAVGAFGSFYYLISIVQIVILSLGQVVSPRMAKAFLEQDKDRFIKLVSYLIILTIVFSALFVLMALVLEKYIFLVLFNKDFYNYIDLYRLIMFLSPLQLFVIVIGTINTSRRRIKYQPYIFFLLLILNLFFSYFMINNYSIVGAVYSTAVVSMMTIIFLLIYTVRGPCK